MMKDIRYVWGDAASDEICRDDMTDHPLAPKAVLDKCAEHVKDTVDREVVDSLKKEATLDAIDIKAMGILWILQHCSRDRWFPNIEEFLDGYRHWRWAWGRAKELFLWLQKENVVSDAVTLRGFRQLRYKMHGWGGR